jgi:hypothetical protein
LSLSAPIFRSPLQTGWKALVRQQAINRLWEIVPMEKSTLKAREIEALTFLYTGSATSPAGGNSFSRGRGLRGRPATVALAAAFVAIATLAWVMLR